MEAATQQSSVDESMYNRIYLSFETQMGLVSPVQFSCSVLSTLYLTWTVALRMNQVSVVDRFTTAEHKEALSDSSSFQSGSGHLLNILKD